MKYAKDVFWTTLDHRLRHGGFFKNIPRYVVESDHRYPSKLAQPAVGSLEDRSPGAGGRDGARRE